MAGWTWYTYTKLARGELLEAADGLEGIRSLAVPPYVHAAEDIPPYGYRFLERRARSTRVEQLMATHPRSIDRAELLRCLMQLAALYIDLETELGDIPPEDAPLHTIMDAIRRKETAGVGPEELLVGTSVTKPSHDEPTPVIEIEATARDYIEGWYTGDQQRMERSLHRELVKRTASDDDPDALREVSRSRMVELTADGGGDMAAADVEIAIDDVSDHIATARVISPEYVDYRHLVRTPEGWRIANVLFRNRS